MWKEIKPEKVPTESNHIFTTGGVLSGMRVSVSEPKDVSDSRRIVDGCIRFSEWVTNDLESAKLAALVAFRDFILEQLANLDDAIAATQPVEAK